MKIHAIYRCAALFLVLCLLPAGTHAAPSVDVIITANGSTIAGSGSPNTPNNNFINGLGFDHEVVVERDAASGQSTGRRQHKPIRIVKPIDKSTPLLYKAMVQNQVIAGEFKFWRPNPSGPAGGGGSLVQYYTVSITGGRIAGIRDWKTNTRDLSAERAGDLEEVSFTYTSITWTWVDGGITHTDTWSTAQ